MHTCVQMPYLQTAAAAWPQFPPYPSYTTVLQLCAYALPSKCPCICPTCKQLPQLGSSFFPHESFHHPWSSQVLLNLLTACQLVRYAGALARSAALNQCTRLACTQQREEWGHGGLVRVGEGGGWVRRGELGHMQAVLLSMRARAWVGRGKQARSKANPTSTEELRRQGGGGWTCAPFLLLLAREGGGERHGRIPFRSK